jgi:hypothetical protein
MISGGAAGRGEREDEAESDKPNGTQHAPDNIEHAPDKIEGALSSALSPEHASDKGDEAPESLNEARSSSKDKGVPSEPGHTNSLKVITMHSKAESSIVISPKADKNKGTQLSLDERAQDKNEDEEGNKIPPPLFKKCPQDNDKGLRSPETLAKMASARERTKQQKAAQEISSSPEERRQLPKKKDQTGQWQDRSNRDKSAAPRIKGSSGSVIRTTLFPHGTKPFRYAQNNDNEETQLIALGQTILQNDKSEGDKEANDNNDDSSTLLDDLCQEGKKRQLKCTY